MRYVVVICEIILVVSNIIIISRFTTTYIHVMKGVLILKPNKKETYPKLNNWYTYGKNDEIILTNKLGQKKVIVDKNGKIMDFPGIDSEDFWLKEIGDGSISPYVRYRTEFSKCDNNKWMMLWEIQPDGSYWEDEDGFGGNSDQEITLYTYFDDTGTFLAPFKVYRVGIKKYL